VLANSISLTQIAVGGGNVVQADTVWGLDSAGRIYHAQLSGTSWVFSRVPGVLDLIAVGIGYQDNCHRYEVWGLSSTLIYRYNFCAKNWERVPGALTTLAVGDGDIWGINGNGDVYYFYFPSFSFKPLYTGFYALQIAVGPTSIWLLASYGDLFEFVDGRGVHAFGFFSSPLAQVQAGGNGVWAIDSSQQVFHFEHVNVCVCQMQGALVSISVGTGGGVWGINHSGNPYVFTTP